MTEAEGTIVLIAYCIICWCGMLLFASWRISQEKMKGKDFLDDDDQLPEDFIYPNITMVVMAPLAVPIIVLFCIFWLLEKIPHVIAAGFTDIQKRIRK
jgi:uncharacterized membrane protein